eukprot:TRINITY_DN36696_c0_g1_i1.p1 TRINITY_DN36696_c0_g1~~TRINITY_DN36696_c0_g1_i1.p1  ORF type:complete len:362 (-),score=52.85 TRINITY_DN36696_c0_g1_i1:105-1133(-)
MDDVSRRKDEAEVLASMYYTEFFRMSANEWVLRHSSAEAELTIRLPDDYPSNSPPELVLDAPGRGGLDEACRDILSRFAPGEEFGLVLAEWFCAFGEDQGDPHMATDGCEVATDGGDITQDMGTSPMAVVINVDPSLAHKVGESLADAGFQRHGTGVFVQGEFGVVVEIREALHVSVDGVDAEQILVDFLTERLNPMKNEIASFGESLLKWADACRVSDGLTESPGEHVDEPQRAPGVVLTGNAAWKARLQAGETVCFRGGGNSLHPRIKSGECCRYEPVFKHEDIKEKDVVFCQIKGRYWGHIVKKKDARQNEYTISNIHGWENGTCRLENIYGKVVDHWK